MTSKPSSDAENQEVDQAKSTSPLAIWSKAISRIGGYVADCAAVAAKIDVALDGNWKVYFPLGSDFALSECQTAANFQRLTEVVREVCGSDVRISLVASTLPPTKAVLATKKSIESPQASQSSLIRKYNEHPLVRSLLQTLDGQILRVDSPQQAIPNPVNAPAPVLEVSSTTSSDESASNENQ